MGREKEADCPSIGMKLRDATAGLPSGRNERKAVAIVQSCYIPWKGYFDLMSRVDEFILYDDVKFTRRDWRNRNLIKTADGASWLTIPIKVKGKFDQLICEATISDPNWAKKHWKSICHAYQKAPHFAVFKERFEELYCDCKEEYLSRINYRFLRAVMEILQLQTKLTWSMDYRATGDKSLRLVELCRRTGATEYYSGPSARKYLDEKQFKKASITLHWMDYGGYQPYNQLFPPFLHHVSLLDLIFCEGPNATRYMKSL